MSLEYKKFSDIDLTNRFFDSLKNDYPTFEEWFKKKKDANAYISYNKKSEIDGFLYIKIEDEALSDMNQQFPQKRRLKLGTFKIEAHGTKLGERFIRIIFNRAMDEKINEIYVTIYDKHQGLINLLQRYGFLKKAKKNEITKNGQEGVYFKLLEWSDSVLNNYPLVKLDDRNFLLSIYPKWHSRLFPESKLNNENSSIIKDISHTNSIEKVYLTKMPETESLRKGDNLLIYRTTDRQGQARFRSVATSVCVVQEVLNIRNFRSYEEFYKYCEPYSVFNSTELNKFYKEKKYPIIIRFTYNFPLNKKVTRDDIMTITRYTNENYWGFLSIKNTDFKEILNLGHVNESFIINKA